MKASFQEMSTQIRVLHVDDEPSFADMVTQFLEREDDQLSVETALSASEGLDRLAQTEFDCIVSDYDMPSRNGIEFLETIREDHPDLPFILYTGKGSEEIAGEAITAGVTDYLQKGRGTDQYTVLANRICNVVETQQERSRADRLEEEYSLIAESATDAFWVYDLRTEKIRYDGFQCLGYESESIDASLDWWIAHLHPDDRERIAHFLDSLLVGEKWAFDHLTENHGRVSIEYQFQRADGTYATCCGRGIFLFEDDEPAKIIGTVTDITQQRNRERQLQDANNRYQTLVENIPNGTVCLFDEELRFSMAAGQGSPNISITPSNIEGKTVKEIASTEEYQEWEALYRSTLDGEHHSFDYVFDGQIHRTHLIPVETDVEGGRQGMLLIQDVTEHRKHEAELELKTERLERFAAILSHDLRNPLAVARGWNEMLSIDCDTEASEHIEEALRRMGEIIVQMENLVQTGEIRDQEPVQLEDLIHQAWDVEKVETASLEVVTELGTVTCSPSLARELLENLFRNAIDHSGNTVTIQVGPLEGDYGFYVEDDGPGIPAGERDIVFDAGYSTNANGTGYGLLIVKEIAAAHRWKISVSESTPTGARFEIRTGKDLQPT